MGGWTDGRMGIVRSTQNICVRALCHILSRAQRTSARLITIDYFMLMKRTWQEVGRGRQRNQSMLPTLSLEFSCFGSFSLNNPGVAIVKIIQISQKRTF